MKITEGKDIHEYLKKINQQIKSEVVTTDRLLLTKTDKTRHFTVLSFQ